jgi:hypothetical protein
VSNHPVNHGGCQSLLLQIRRKAVIKQIAAFDQRAANASLAGFVAIGIKCAIESIYDRHIFLKVILLYFFIL